MTVAMFSCFVLICVLSNHQFVFRVYVPASFFFFFVKRRCH